MFRRILVAILFSLLLAGVESQLSTAPVITAQTFTDGVATWTNDKITGLTSIQVNTSNFTIGGPSNSVLAISGLVRSGTLVSPILQVNTMTVTTNILGAAAVGTIGNLTTQSLTVRTWADLQAMTSTSASLPQVEVDGNLSAANLMIRNVDLSSLTTASLTVVNNATLQNSLSVKGLSTFLGGVQADSAVVYNLNTTTYTTASYLQTNNLKGGNLWVTNSTSVATNLSAQSGTTVLLDVSKDASANVVQIAGGIAASNFANVSTGTIAGYLNSTQLQADGMTNIMTNLVVGGQSNLTGPVSVTNFANVSGTLFVGSNSVLGAQASTNTTFGANVKVMGTVSAVGKSSITGNLTTQQNVQIVSGDLLSSSLNVNGTTFGVNLNVSGNGWGYEVSSGTGHAGPTITNLFLTKEALTVLSSTAVSSFPNLNSTSVETPILNADFIGGMSATLNVTNSSVLNGESSIQSNNTISTFHVTGLATLTNTTFFNVSCQNMTGADGSAVDLKIGKMESPSAQGLSATFANLTVYGATSMNLIEVKKGIEPHLYVNGPINIKRKLFAPSIEVRDFEAGTLNVARNLQVPNITATSTSIINGTISNIYATSTSVNQFTTNNLTVWGLVNVENGQFSVEDRGYAVYTISSLPLTTSFLTVTNSFFVGGVTTVQHGAEILGKSSINSLFVTGFHAYLDFPLTLGLTFLDSDPIFQVYTYTATAGADLPVFQVLASGATYVGVSGGSTTFTLNGTTNFTSDNLVHTGKQYGTAGASPVGNFAIRNKNVSMSGVVRLYNNQTSNGDLLVVGGPNVNSSLSGDSYFVVNNVTGCFSQTQSLNLVTTSFVATSASPYSGSSSAFAEKIVLSNATGAITATFQHYQSGAWNIYGTGNAVVGGPTFVVSNPTNNIHLCIGNPAVSCDSNPNTKQILVTQNDTLLRSAEIVFGIGTFTQYSKTSSTPVSAVSLNFLGFYINLPLRLMGIIHSRQVVVFTNAQITNIDTTTYDSRIHQGLVDPTKMFVEADYQSVAGTSSNIAVLLLSIPSVTDRSQLGRVQYLYGVEPQLTGVAQITTLISTGVTGNTLSYNTRIWSMESSFRETKISTVSGSFLSLQGLNGCLTSGTAPAQADIWGFSYVLRLDSTNLWQVVPTNIFKLAYGIPSSPKCPTNY